MIQETAVDPTGPKTQYTRSEFATMLRNKYPDYNDMDDQTLTQSVLDAYPEYQDMIIEEEPVKKKDDQQAQVTPYSVPLDGNQTSVAPASVSEEEPSALELGGPDLTDPIQTSPLRIGADDYVQVYQSAGYQSLDRVLSPYYDQIGVDGTFYLDALKNNLLPSEQVIDELSSMIAKNEDLSRELGIDVPSSWSYTGGTRQTQTYQRRPEEVAKDRESQLKKMFKKNLYAGMSPILMEGLEDKYKSDPDSLKLMEQHMLETYGSMIDLTGEGEVGNTPFLDADFVPAFPGQPPRLEVSGYIVDKGAAAGMDLINGFYNFFGGDAKTVEERRKQAEKIRATTLQFVDGVGEGDFENGVKQVAGFLSEASPTLAVTLPLAAATGGMGLGTYATIAAIAAEGATVHTMQEWARVKYNPEWSIYRKDGKEYSYSQMMLATGGNPEDMAKYTEDDNFMGKVGYLSNVFGTSLLADGATSALFLKALKGVNPYGPITKDMGQWWKYHLASAGIAAPQAATSSSIAAMQQYIAAAEAKGEEVSWADVKEVGYDAALSGAALGPSVSMAGSLLNVSLARDPFGRRNGNMEFYRQEMELIRMRGEAKTAKESALIDQAYERLTKLNDNRLIADQEFYSRVSESDLQELMPIAREMNQKYRDLMQIADKDSPLAKQLADEIDVLAKRRFEIEEPYEVSMMTEDGQRPTVIGDDGSMIAPSVYAKDYVEQPPDPIEPLELLTPKNLFEEGVSRAGGEEALAKYRSYYESLVDALDAPRRVQKAIEKQKGERVPITQDLDIALRTVESRAAAMIEDAKAGRSETLVPGLRELHNSISKKTPGAELLPEGVKPSGLTMLDRYMYALHAPERNAQIYKKHETELAELKAKKNPSDAVQKRIKDLEEYMTTKNGSGMSDAEAQAFIDALDPAMKTKMDELVTQIRPIQQHTRDVLYESGMISKDHYEYLNSNFEHYVPLMGRSVDEMIIAPDGNPVADNQGLPNIPARMQVNRDMLREALGRKGETADILGKILFQESSSIIMGSRNMANQKLLNMLEANPDPTSYTISKEGRAADEGTITVYRDGEPNYITFKDPSFAKNMKYMDPKTTDQLMNDMGAFMRGAASIRKFFVNYNPTFGPVAYARDTQTGYVHALSMLTRERGYLLRDKNGMNVDTGAFLDALTANQAGSLRLAMTNEVRGGKGNPDTQMGRLYEQFRVDGGKTGWAFMDNLQDLSRKLEAEIKPANRAKLMARWFKRNSIGLVESMNNGYENAARFNAYRTAIETGIDRETAAAFAKYVTVDFNRRGTAARQIGAWKFFFNPAIQGVDQSIGVLTTPKPLHTQSGRKRTTLEQYGPQAGMMSALVALGISMSEWNDAVSGMDPSGRKYYDQIPDAVKRKNVIFMIPGSKEYIKLPKTYGYGGIYDMGVAAYDQFTGKRELGNAALYMSSSITENFMPFYLSEFKEEDEQKLGELGIGTVAETAYDIAAPDALKPMLDAYVLNRTPFGTPVAVERKGYSRAGSARRSPEVIQNFFDYLNELGGGSEYKSGNIWGFSTDYNPDQSYYLAKAYLGGLATFAEQTAENVRDYRALRASDWPDSDNLLDVDNIPFVRQFYSDSYENQLYKEYYDMKERMTPYRNEFRDWRTLNENIQKQLPQADLPQYDAGTDANAEKLAPTYDDVMKQFPDDSQEFRYLAYLTTARWQLKVDKFLSNEGLDYNYKLITEQLAELNATPLSDEAKLQKYTDLRIQQEQLDALRLSMIATYLNYANQVMPPRMK